MINPEKLGECKTISPSKSANLLKHENTTKHDKLYHLISKREESGSYKQILKTSQPLKLVVISGNGEFISFLYNGSEYGSRLYFLNLKDPGFPLRVAIAEGNIETIYFNENDKCLFIASDEGSMYAFATDKLSKLQREKQLK